MRCSVYLCDTPSTATAWSVLSPSSTAKSTSKTGTSKPSTGPRSKRQRSSCILGRWGHERRKRKAKRTVTQLTPMCGNGEVFLSQHMSTRYLICWTRRRWKPLVPVFLGIL
eukprot:PhF_6_TR34181/c1_g1_i2/m.50040